jgi:hypothetical protein
MYLEPLHTKIEKQIETFLGDIVMESHNGFPQNESNIYMVGKDGKIIWVAELPDSKTHFSRVKLNADGETFSTYTLGHHAGDHQLRTGKLISFTTLK